MKHSRNVLLFGSGAVIDWKAPSTPDLTKLVRESGFKITGNEITITDFIYEQLRASNYTETSINFETIINVIEELIVYYSYFDAREKLPSLTHTIFSSKFEEELLNFSIIGGEAKHGFNLEIPKGTPYENSIGAFNNETPNQFFFQLLVSEILSEIVESIEKYAYHSTNSSKVITDDNFEINQLFSKWINQINQTGNDIFRMYSLNYDRIFKIILEEYDEHITIFEGFSCNNKSENDSKLTPNIRKILEDVNCNVHYNLHGSIFWKVEARDGNQLPNPTFYLTDEPFFPRHSFEQATYQSEKGKTIMLTNIITGYQKTQRGIFSPFKQMQASFDKDCCFADNIYIVGYSFNDEHINASIKTAIQYNKDVKITIIEPSFTKYNNDLDIAKRIFSCEGNMSNINPQHKEKIRTFFDGKFTVHEKTFKEYLKSQLT